MAEQPKPQGRVLKTTKQALDAHAPWKPTPWETEHAGAIQALIRGDAQPHQQQRAITFIIYNLCGVHDLPYRPGGHEGDRDTAFAAGKMFVGQQLVKLSKVKFNEGDKG